MNIKKRIEELKKEKNAVILTHNYEPPELQDIADYLGDSLGLSIKAAETDADIIVFCGVRFMAETAKILSPEKTVLLPNIDAGCPMADMITASELKELKSKYPDAQVLCYVNTSAEVKANSDLCCTSANSVKLTEKAFKEDDKVIFVPDKNLAHYTKKKTGHDFIIWDGYCPIHTNMNADDVARAREKYSDADLIVHPECNSDVVDLADGVFSTSGMSKYVKESDKKSFIIGTEVGMLYRLEQDNPDKEFYPLSNNAICKDMKKITLELLLQSLEEETGNIELDRDIIEKARGSIDKMIQFR